MSGDFVDAPGEPVPTGPVARELVGTPHEVAVLAEDTDFFLNGVRATIEAVPGEPEKVRLRATLPDANSRTFPLGIYGPNPGDELRPAPRPTITLPLDAYSTDELLAELNRRFAAMQEQARASGDAAARLAQIALIAGRG